MNYGMRVKLDSGEAQEQRFENSQSLDDLKASALDGIEKPFVSSVCIFNYDGQVELFVKKTPEGIYREER
jgi:hypothetical protein